jgi:hypothetical protein
MAAVYPGVLRTRRLYQGRGVPAGHQDRLIAVAGRLTRHARHLTLRLPPGHYLLPEVLARLRGPARTRLICTC